MSGPAGEPESPLPPDWEPTEADFADAPEPAAEAVVTPSAPEAAASTAAAPLGVAATIGRTLSIWASTLPWLVPLVTVALAPQVFVEALVYDQEIRWSDDPESTAPPDAAIAWGVAVLHPFLFALAVATAFGAVAARLAGARPRFATSLRLALSRLPALAGIALILASAYVATQVLSRVFFELGLHPVAATALPTIAWFAAQIGWYVAVPAACGDALGPFVSLRTSLRLTLGHRWRIAFLVVLFSAANWAVHALAERHVDRFAGHDWLWFTCSESVTILVSTLLVTVPTVVHDRLRSTRDGLATTRLEAIFR